MLRCDPDKIPEYSVNENKYYIFTPPENICKLETICLAISNLQPRFPFTSTETPANIHLIKNGEHRLLRMLFEKTVEHHYVVKEIRTYTYSDAVESFRDMPSRDDFIRDLNRMPQVVEEEEVFEEKKAKPMQGPHVLVPDTLQLKGIAVHLSHELKRGIAGKRAADHSVSLDTLMACLETKENKLRQAIQVDFETIKFYFKKGKSEGGRILAVVVKKFRQPHFPKVVALTAYHMSHSVFNHEAKTRQAVLSDVDFEL